MEKHAQLILTGGVDVVGDAVAGHQGEGGASSGVRLGWLPGAGQAPVVPLGDLEGMGQVCSSMNAGMFAVSWGCYGP